MKNHTVLFRFSLLLFPFCACAHNTLTEAERTEGWRLLWDGKGEPTEWVGIKEDFLRFPTKGWTWQNGELRVWPRLRIRDGKTEPLPQYLAKWGGGGTIVTARTYRDFHFKVDYKLTAAANSGIKYFFDERQNGMSSEEFQILDKDHPDYANPTHRVGALYDLMPAADAEKAQRPVGEWNTAEVISRGNHVEHWLNGVKVLEYERGGAAFRAAVAKSKYAALGKDLDGKPQPWGELKEGRLLLQDHSDTTIYFRNIKVREFPVVVKSSSSGSSSSSRMDLARLFSHSNSHSHSHSHSNSHSNSNFLTVTSEGMTPREALMKIRAAKAAGDDAPWTVRVKKGFYELGETLTFTPEDSGTSCAPVRWIGEPGAVFSGGVRVTGWRDCGDGTWEAPAPTERAMEQLWVNGRRAGRSRWPKKGEFRPADYVRNYAVTNGGVVIWREEMPVTNAEVKAALAAMTPEELLRAQLVGWRVFCFTRRVLREYDAAKGVLVTYAAYPQRAHNDFTPEREKDWMFCALENVRAGFADPGDWFYDAPAKKIRYRPLPGETPEGVCAVGSVGGRSRIVAFHGEPGKNRFVHDITFEGISFEHAAISATGHTCEEDFAGVDPDRSLDGAPTGATQNYGYQAAIGSDGALCHEGVQAIRYENCAVRHTGNYGLDFGAGCTRSEVLDCVVEDVGAGGVKLGVSTKNGPVADGETLARREMAKLSPLSTAFITVSNCAIRAGGRTNAEGVGVVIVHASDNRILHNDITDLYYSGISAGMTWGYGGSVAQRNEIGFNHIWKVGQRVMSDMGGIYLLATSYGTHVHGNVIHDVFGRENNPAAWGIYFDEGTEGVIVERNLVYDTEDGSLFQHYGTLNLVQNNIFAFNRMKGAIRANALFRHGVPSSVQFVNNIVVTEGSPLVMKDAAWGEKFGEWRTRLSGVWAANVWYDYAGQGDFSGMDFAAWSKLGKESASVYADPLFVDAAKRDFRMKPDSPALKLGFKPFDIDRSGRQRK